MHRRPESLPDQMQGRWIDTDDDGELIIAGFDVTYRGRRVAHDFFTLSEEEGALTAELGVDDQARADSFQRDNVAAVVIDPDGQLHAYNTKFASSFERAGA